MSESVLEQLVTQQSEPTPAVPTEINQVPDMCKATKVCAAVSSATPTDMPPVAERSAAPPTHFPTQNVLPRQPARLPSQSVLPPISSYPLLETRGPNHGLGQAPRYNPDQPRVSGITPSYSSATEQRPQQNALPFIPYERISHNYFNRNTLLSPQSDFPRHRFDSATSRYSHSSRRKINGNSVSR